MSPQIQFKPPHDPYAPPRAGIGGPPLPSNTAFAVRRGQALVFPKGAELPHACVKCGATQNLSRETKLFRYTPPWAAPMFFLFGIGGIVVLLLRPKGTAQLSVCAACTQRLQSAMRAMWICMAVMFAGFFPAVVLQSTAGALATCAMVFASAIALLIVSAVKVRPAGLVFVEKIDKTSLWLRGIHPSVAERMVGGIR